MKKNHLMLTIGLIVTVIMITVIVYIGLFHYGNPRAGQLFVTNINVSKDQIWLEGSTSCSGEAYKNYDYSIKDGDVYVKIKYVLAGGPYKHGDFDITIKDDFSQINNVYLYDGEVKKLIWDKDTESVKATAGAIGKTTAITLPVDRIVSGEAVEGRVGGTYKYKLTADELKAFVDFFNAQGYSDTDKKGPSMNNTAMDDSIDLIMLTTDGKTITILFYYDGETVITDENSNTYSIFDHELTDYMNRVIGWYLLEKGTFE